MNDALTAEITKLGSTARAGHLITPFQSLNKNLAFGAASSIFGPFSCALCPRFEQLAAAFEVFAVHSLVPWRVTRETPIEMAF